MYEDIISNNMYINDNNRWALDFIKYVFPDSFWKEGSKLFVSFNNFEKTLANFIKVCIYKQDGRYRNQTNKDLCYWIARVHDFDIDYQLI